MIKDQFRKEFAIGDTVIRAYVVRSSGHMHLCKVTDIKDGKLYLDNSKQAIQYPNRLIIWEKQDV